MTDGPLLLELDEETWADQLDRASAWLGNLLMSQEKFRTYAEDAAGKIEEPHIREYLREIAGRAAEHEEQARGLFLVLGREPTAGRSTAGAVLAKGAELVADVVGRSGGARGNWRDVRQLLLANQDAIGAFAVAEQLGYALGLPELADPCFRLVAEKTKDQLLIQEYMLEMGPMAILLGLDA
ncbi:hypothetical protein [Tautonia plasticadhaerens]|uniref:Ferritin-like domain protein n=1 Tax=Tautonia plasticadhaerens TaxID=2527974 RepID=A0A518H1D5_9BACT|nr:hypothetical protein [Tautonia plasticadhaerens]QDV34642.1 hypothetical protein ElP_25340 [Tautonia plasticadhaerens]